MKEILEKIDHHRKFLVSLLVIWGTYFSFLFGNIVKIKSDGIFFGHVNVWSDWALHIAIANIFAFKPASLWFVCHPIFADGQFTYPFFADMVSGFLMRLGISLEMSFFIPSIIAIAIFIVSFYFLGYLVTGRKSISFISVNVFLLSAGLGFINYFKDLFSNFTWTNLLYPAKDYGALFRYDWYAGNVVVGLMLPQRAFLFGITFGICSLVGLLFVLKADPTFKWNKLILFLSGLVAGILPIVHPHSLIALVVIAGTVCVANYKKWRLLSWYVLPAGILSTILFFIFIYGGIGNSKFFSYFPGWGTDSLWEWLWMWFQFWGPTILLTTPGFYFVFKKSNRTIKYFFVSFVLLFILTNIFLFQPIRWDNSKLFWWVYVGFSILSAVGIYRIWRIKKYLAKIIAVILLIAICLTGFIELSRLIQTERHSYIGTSRDDIELGLTLRRETEPLARFLTRPSHNHFVMVWASRPIFMGYSAWVYNYGFDSYKYEEDLKIMYAGGQEAEDLLKKHRISYVVIGSTEIKDQKANESYYQSRFPVAYENNDNRIYDTRDLMVPK